MEINGTNYVLQMKKKNKKALKFVMDSYGNLIYGIVRNVLNTGNDEQQNIEECINDVFLSVWSNIESFDETKGNFKSWIAAISKYKAIDYKKKLGKQYFLEQFAENELYDELTTESIIIAKENRRELFAALHEMNDQDREIFIRRYFLSEGIENIAQTFSVDRNVVDQRLSRGRKFLKEKLASKGEICNG
ncbi:RNA polymerase, sigma-24 subunit, ECF subfamily [Syntrophobotulus glycolicus DSM 8271]|uniref:RNA polymerase, sigma-24 subunit, ECF subfamily n=1 Tax=Syntrophobotulus glycolicus (strain DSM 8271 / FlGlyR) TaxID=645991 RepID=F0SWI2_SYNGF|nr:sigma-70 family RNA polymerase sigma factor [Syntrophobotulus glycolicus]ADY55748.1 RNA polymerase, sigma-24 subunit, ECF subfamily [Syntrophobotulus glycolicus DSM 8271]